MKSPPETFPCKISWSLIQLLSLTSSALWMSLKKKGRQGKKTSQCDWRRKKTFSNYSTRSPASLNLSVWWLHGFFFFTPLNGFLCCQPFQRDLPHLPHNPLTFIKYICGGIAVWASKSLSIPHICTSAAAADSWHHNSLCLCRKKGCKGPRRSSHHISLSRPVSEIISGTDKLPGSYFYFFFYSALLYETGRRYRHTDPGFRTRVPLSSFLTWSHAPALRQRSPGLSKASPHIVSFITVSGFKVKTTQTLFSIQQNTDAVLNPERALSRDRERQFLTVV